MSYASMINRESGIFGSWGQVAGTRPAAPLLLRPPRGMGAALRGLGAEYPYETTMVAYQTTSGVPGVVTVTTADNCGNVYGLQQMLQTLGFAVQVTGTLSMQDYGAIASFAGLRQIPYVPGNPPRGDVCRALIAEYVRVMSGQQQQLPGTPLPVPGTCPPGTTGTFPICVPGAAPAPTTPAEPAPPEEKKTGMMALWEAYTPLEKGLVAAGSAMGALALGVLLFGEKKPSGTGMFTANREAKPWRTKTGLPIVRGKAWGHASAPKKYRKLGATRASQYAYPDRYMYPIMDRGHVIAAKSRFDQNKRAYPTSMRRQIARNINKAARKHHLAPVKA